MRKRLAHSRGIMKWEEIIAEARAAGILAFCSEGIAVLKRRDAEKKPVESTPGEDRSEGREIGQGQSESAPEQTGS